MSGTGIDGGYELINPTDLAAVRKALQIGATENVFIGVDDGVTDNSTTWVTFKASLPFGSRVHFTKQTTGVYRFSSVACDLSNLVVDVDSGVTLAGNIDLNTDISVVRPTHIYYDVGITYDYWVGPRPRPLERPPLMSIPRGEAPTYVTVPASGLYVEKLSWSNSDTWNVDGTASYSLGNAQWNDLANDGYMRAAFTNPWGVSGFRELTWSWDYVSASSILNVAVKCSNGWVVFSCTGEATSGTVYYRPTSGPTTNAPVYWWQPPTTHQSWYPRMAVWGVRPLTPYKFAITMNGVAVATISTSTVGWITECGPAVLGTASTAGTTPRAGRLCQTESSVPTFGQRVGLLVIGDSKSDTTSNVTSPARYPVGWGDYAAAYVDGSSGCRVSHYVNIAVAGATSADQATALTTFLATPAAGNITHAVIAVGTNDVQGLVNPSSVYTTVASMITALQSAGIEVVISIPDEFYSRSLASANTSVSNYGQNTSNYATGAGLRTVLRQLASDMSTAAHTVGLVDGTRVIGMELADWLSGTYWTSARLADNIHGNGLTWPQVIGQAVAEALISNIRPRWDGVAVGLPVPQCRMGSGFATTSSLYVSYMHGTARLHGYITKSSGSWSAALVMTWFRCFAPATNSRQYFEDGSLVGVTMLVNGSGGSWCNVNTYTSSTASQLQVNHSLVCGL